MACTTWPRPFPLSVASEFQAAIIDPHTYFRVPPSPTYFRGHQFAGGHDVNGVTVEQQGFNIFGDSDDDLSASYKAPSYSTWNPVAASTST